MNIQSVQAFDAAVGQLGAIKGDVTQNQLEELTNLFSTKIWNTSDTEGTKANLEAQIQKLQALLDEIQAEIDDLYAEQKQHNEQMNRLLDDINNESYQASKQMDQNAKQQQELVENATDDVYRRYMKGEISKDEIPTEIAKALGKMNPSAATKLQASLDQMDVYGQKIYSLSDKIAGILDNVNELTAKMKTTETSIGLMQQLLAQVPEHKERADIQSTIANPVYTPTQEALGDKLIDSYKVVNDGAWADGNAGTAKLNEALQGSTKVDEARKAELDAMTPEAKAAAVEEADTSKYTALELMYLSGMDQYQAGKAIETIFNGAGVGYNEQTGAIISPQGHDGVAAIFKNLRDQYVTLWGGKWEAGSETANGQKGGADPFSWRNGDTTYILVKDRDGDLQFDGQNELVGAEAGLEELTAADADNDGHLTADEMVAAGFSVMDNNQAFTGGGTYGWNGIKESGVKEIDLTTLREITGIKAVDLNGNDRTADFNVILNDQNGDGVDETTLGKQTLFKEEYFDKFYGHTVGEAIAFGLDENEVAQALAEAAKPQNYTEAEEELNNILTEVTEDTIDANTEALKNKAENVDNIGKAEKTGNATVIVGDNEVENEEETTTTETDAALTTEPAEDEYFEEEDII